MDRIIEYHHLRRYYFCVYILMIASPIVGFILFKEANWWMIITCVLAYSIQLGLWSQLIENLEESDYIIEKITVRQLKQVLKKEKCFKYGSIIVAIIISILDLYPLFAMNKSFMIMMGGWRVYEGGILVYLMSVSASIINIIYSIRLDYTDLFKINDNFIKTGMTPSQILKKERQNKQNAEKQRIESEKKKYGEDYNIISREHKIYVNEKEKKIFLIGKEYNFKDIINFTVQDKSQTINIGPTYTSKTNTGSMLGRAAIGGALLGNVGAVIGGASASKTIQASNSYSYEEHNYSIIITVDSINKPTIIINIGDNNKLMNKIQSLLTVIIKRNNLD